MIKLEELQNLLDEAKSKRKEMIFETSPKVKYEIPKNRLDTVEINDSTISYKDGGEKEIIVIDKIVKIILN